MKKIDFNRKYIEYDRIYIKIEIVGSDLSLESESDSNRRSNLDRDFNLTTTIRFGTSNRISLLFTFQLKLNNLQELKKDFFPKLQYWAHKIYL